MAFWRGLENKNNSFIVAAALDMKLFQDQKNKPTPNHKN
jgi:hypothetical protein